MNGEPMRTDNDKGKILKKIIDEAVSYIETLLIMCFSMVMLFTFVFRLISVEGDSMQNTLQSGDCVLINQLVSHYETGDIIVADADKAVVYDQNGELSISEGIGITIIKRVIATGGQTIDINFQNGKVTVDGEVLREDYLSLGMTHLDEGAFTGKYPVTVPEGYVFVMGDHRSVSKDSRSGDVGFVPEDCIRGKVLLRYLPVSEFTLLAA